MHRHSIPDFLSWMRDTFEDIVTGTVDVLLPRPKPIRIPVRHRRPERRR